MKANVATTRDIKQMTYIYLHFLSLFMVRFLGVSHKRRTVGTVNT